MLLMIKSRNKTEVKKMTKEIELKYLIPINHGENDLAADKITAMLKEQNKAFIVDKKQFNNSYFDNEALALRKMDIGLRIREDNHQYEQTVKTAGTVVGCMHQRPEYNVNIERNQLNLLLFPKKIWPEQVDVAKLQQSLQVIFQTNFFRQTWLITQEKSVIELALDRGEIFTSTNVKTLSINELEIELVNGDEKALFTLAEQLMTVIQMKPGKLSKAARGYALYDQRVNSSDY